MSERCQGSIGCCAEDLRQALSIHTQKITDSCRDKDCIEDLRVYLTQSSQKTLDTCTGAKVRCADLLYTYIDVEPVAFDRNRYCIDLTFYYRILADATVGVNRPVALQGLAMFSKRAVLCGEDSRAHIYTSRTRLDGIDGLSRVSTNHPTAVVEVLDPMVLSSKIQERCSHGTVAQIPACIAGLFDEDLVSGDVNRMLLVTLGQFSIIRLERDTQLLVPVLDYSLPSKECCDAPGCGEDPCDMFSRIPFPENQFAPRGCDDCSANLCDS